MISSFALNSHSYILLGLQSLHVDGVLNIATDQGAARTIQIRQLKCGDLVSLEIF